MVAYILIGSFSKRSLQGEHCWALIEMGLIAQHREKYGMVDLTSTNPPPGAITMATAQDLSQRN